MGGNFHESAKKRLRKPGFAETMTVLKYRNPIAYPFESQLKANIIVFPSFNYLDFTVK